jgi:ribosomal protein S27E
MHKCPRNEQRFWNSEGVFEVQCSGCGQTIEFFEDDEKQKCRKCGLMVVNPNYHNVG